MLVNERIVQAERLANRSERIGGLIVTRSPGITASQFQEMTISSPAGASLQLVPRPEMLVEEHLNSNNEPFKFNGKELDEETGNYYYGARYYNPKWSIWLSVDPLAEEYPGWSPYNYTLQNPLNLTDPTGMAPEDIIDIAKNDQGKWEITNVQITEGDDVFRVTDGDKVSSYTFSEGEYGERFNVLNLENNDNYTLGVYHISGQDAEGATGFVVTPGGTASTKVGSNKRLPDDVYSLTGTGNGNDQSAYKWVQPLLNSGEQGGYVGARGVKIHPAPSKLFQTEASQWTAGCYVVSKDYSIQNGKVFFNSNQSIQTSKQINTILGGTTHYDSVGRRGRPGSDFNNGINFQLIQLTRF